MRIVIDTGPCAAMGGAGPAAWPSHGRGREPCKSAPSSPPPAKRKARHLQPDPTSKGITLRLLPLPGLQMASKEIASAPKEAPHTPEELSRLLNLSRFHGCWAAPYGTVYARLWPGVPKRPVESANRVARGFMTPI